MNATGEDLKQIGMRQAVSHADSTIPKWSTNALQYVKDFQPGCFLAEDVRYFAEADGLPIPPSKRAWGSVMTAARKLGYIKSIGYRLVTNPDAHRTPATYWIKLK